MENLKAVFDWIVVNPGTAFSMAIIFLVIAKKVFALLGFDKGVFIADELRETLEEAKDLIMEARQMRFDDASGMEININKASQQIASKINGVNENDVKTIVTALASNTTAHEKGVVVSLNKSGELTVDPSGLAAKLTKKAGKWLKKI